MRIDVRSHPATFGAILDMEYANDGVNRDNPEPTFFEILPRFVPLLDEIEAGLATLTVAELETFTDGEEREQEEIANRSAGLRAASELLNAIFNGEEE